MKRATPAALIVLVTALAGGRLDYEPVPATVERRVASMGTTLDLVVRMKYREPALEASEAAVTEVQRVEALLTTWKPGGELARVDAAPVGKPVAVSAELAETLAQVFVWIPRTDGAFDPTVLPLVRAWGLRENGRVPTPAELAAARTAVGADRFRIDVPGRTVTRLSAAAEIDEGAWGKGYGLDRAAKVLAAAGVRSAL